MQAFRYRPMAFAATMAAVAAVLSSRMIGTWRTVFFLVLVAALAALLIAVFLFGKRQKRLLEALLCLFAVSVTVGSSLYFFNVRYARFCALEGKEVEVEGTVLERGRSVAYAGSFRVSLDRIDGASCSVDAVIECEFASSMQVGDRFRLRGVARKFNKSDLYDEEMLRLSEDSVLLLSCADSTDCEIGERDMTNPRVLASLLNLRLSYGLRNRIGGEAGGVASALLLGNRSFLSADTVLSFRRAGISHLLALSGLHVSILIAFVDFLTRAFRIRQRARFYLIPLFAFLYLVITGFALSTLRAVLMVVVLYLSILLGEAYDSLTALTTSLMLTLILMPHSVLSLSLWMSYLAAGAIIIFYSKLSWRFSGWLWRRRLPRWIFYPLRALSRAILVGVLANLAMVLLCTDVFGEISLASVPATLVLSLPVTVMLILSALTLCLPFLGFLAPLCGFVGDVILWISELFSDLKNVLLPTSDALTVAVLIIMTALMILFAFIRLSRYRWFWTVPALLALAICTSLCTTHFGPPSELQLTRIKASYGELRLYTQRDAAVLVNDTRGAVTEDYEIKTLATDMRCTEIGDLVFCRYYNQATYFILSLSSSIRVRTVHLPTPTDARERAIAARLAEEASVHGIEVRYDAQALLGQYDASFVAPTN